jgi:beta-glucanase (GH16 family)
MKLMMNCSGTSKMMYYIVLMCLVLSALLSGKDVPSRPMSFAENIYKPTSQALLVPSVEGNDWNVIFHDDFDGQSLDTSKWVTCYWWKDHWWKDDGCTNEANDELQWYQQDDVLVYDGTLKLRAQRRTTHTDTFGKTYQYTSGIINSGRIGEDTSIPAKFVFQYGYAEIRAKIPKGQGLWPGFWLLPANHDSKPEIDVMEILGHEPRITRMSLHYRNIDGSDGKAWEEWKGQDFSADWHTFAVDWQPEAIIWYVDGIERWRYTDRSRIPRSPMYLLVNLAVGGEWPGPPDASTPFPSYYQIDYIQVRVRQN